MEGAEIWNFAAISPAVISPFPRNLRMPRRVGSANALKSSSLGIFLYLANHLNTKPGRPGCQEENSRVAGPGKLPVAEAAMRRCQSGREARERHLWKRSTPCLVEPAILASRTTQGSRR